MEEELKKEILEKAKSWWREHLAESHKNNTLKLTNLDEFNTNPFLWSYLAYYLEGKSDAVTLAKVLVYPRVLGTSITTSFGMGFQQMITKMFEGISGSAVPGMDIEFVDKKDGRTKYCQLKAGPNVINRDDVKTIKDHFRAAINLSRQNHLPVQHNDYMFCLLYGEEWQKNSFIREVEEDYVVAVGQDFWERFTGDENFYSDLVNAIGEVAVEYNMRDTVENVIAELAKEIEKKYPDVVK